MQQDVWWLKLSMCTYGLLLAGCTVSCVTCHMSHIHSGLGRFDRCVWTLYSVVLSLARILKRRQKEKKEECDRRDTLRKCLLCAMYSCDGHILITRYVHMAAALALFRHSCTECHTHGSCSCTAKVWTRSTPELKVWRARHAWRGFRREGLRLTFLN